MKETEFKAEIDRIKAKRESTYNKMIELRENYIHDCSPFKKGDVVIDNGHLRYVADVSVNDVTGEFSYVCYKMRYETWDIIKVGSLHYWTGRNGNADRLRKIGHIDTEGGEQ